MKRSLFYALCLLVSVSSCSPKTQFLTTSPDLSLNETVQDVQDEKERVNLIGVCNRQGFQQAPFEEWYNKNYKEYQPFEPAINKGKKKTKGVEVLAFMGTWCGDSKRGVPQFYKVMDEMGFSEEKIKLVCVSDLADTYKQSPNREEQELNIHRVPTYIFYKNGEEIGRIVESPSTSYEVDIAQILSGLSPTPNYSTQILIHTHLQNMGVEKIEAKLERYGEYVAHYTYSSSELNSYGYVLLGNKKMEEAILIFKINAAAYPHETNVFDSLAEAYLKSGNEELAIENYKKVLTIDRENENAIEELKKLGVKDISMLEHQK